MKYGAAKWERDRRRKEKWKKKIKGDRKKWKKYYAKAKKFWDKEEFSPPVYIGKIPVKKKKITYKEKLKNPKWIERRREIFIRYNFQCQKCKSRLNIQVHHKKYMKNKEPWESPDKDLITLCEYHHKKEHGK